METNTIVDSIKQEIENNLNTIEAILDAFDSRNVTFGNENKFDDDSITELKAMNKRLKSLLIKARGL